MPPIYLGQNLRVFKRLLRNTFATIPAQRRFIHDLTACETDAAALTTTSLAPARSLDLGLPINRTEQDLSRMATAQGYSQGDVATYHLPSLQAQVFKDVLVEEVADRFNNGFYALSLLRRRYLDVPGTGLTALHRRTRVALRSAPAECGIWFFQYWAGNYFHWVAQCLPKAIVLARLYPQFPLLIPSHITLNRFQSESLEYFGLLTKVLRVPASSTRFDRLATLRGTNRLDPFLLQAIRTAANVSDKLSESAADLYASRGGASWRRVTNEAAVSTVLASRRIRELDFAQLSFAQQVATMRNAKLFVGVHGAALANCLFAPAGSAVLEIGHPGYPNPDYYLMARLMGLQYWLGKSIPSPASPKQDVAYQDLEVNIDDLESTLDRMLEAQCGR